MCDFAKKYAKAATGKMKTRVKQLKEDIRTLNKSADLDWDEDARWNESFLHEELRHLERKTAQSSKIMLVAKILNGEGSVHELCSSSRNVVDMQVGHDSKWVTIYLHVFSKCSAACSAQSGTIDAIRNKVDKPVDFCYLYLNG